MNALKPWDSPFDRMRELDNLATVYGQLRAEERISRVQHRCSVCLGEIERSALYVAATIGKGGKVRVTYALHPVCSPWVGERVTPAKAERVWKAIQRAVARVSHPSELPEWAVDRLRQPSLLVRAS